MALERTFSAARTLLAAIIVAWLSGVVFLFCCEKLYAKSSFAPKCPLERLSKHCDKTNRNDLVRPSSEPSHGGCENCCVFLPAVFDKARKIESAQNQQAIRAQIPSAAVSFHPFGYVERNATVPPLRVFDMRRTFVKNCVFRI